MIPRPMLASLASTLPVGPDWSYEVKWDGYRCLAVKNGSTVNLWSRNGANFTARYPTVTAAVATIRARQAILDGEIVAVDARGRPSFQALQHRAALTRHTLVFYAFDVLAENGTDLTRQPIEARRNCLRAIAGGTAVLLSEPLPGTPAQIERELRALGLERAVAKRAGSRYEAGKRTGAWTKVKFQRAQEFVMGGFSPERAHVEIVDQ